MKLLERLPYYFVLLAPIFFIGAFLMAGSEYATAFRLVFYVCYATAETVLAVGYIALVRRSPNGTASVWLVSVMYTAVSFAITLWAIFAILVLRAIYGEPTDTIYGQIAYGFIGIALSAALIAAWLLVRGFRKGGLDYRIHPWPYLPSLRRKRRR